jgi:putative Mn2+ efflux pump MntP
VQLRQAIWRERRVELAMEQQRWFELVRTGQAATRLTPLGFVAGKHELFPIPQSEIDLTGGIITQNPNY